MSDNSSENPIASVLRDEIVKILSAKPLKVEDFAKAAEVARHAGRVLKAADAKFLELPDQAQGIFGAVPSDSDDEEAVAPFPVLAPSSQAENFGSSAIREVIAALPRILAAKNESTAETISAIALAEARGMKKLAAKLKKKLGVENPEETEEPVRLEPFEPIVQVDDEVVRLREQVTQLVALGRQGAENFERLKKRYDEQSATLQTVMSKSSEAISEATAFARNMR